MDKQKKSHRNHVILIVIMTILLIVASVTVTYAIFSFSSEGERENKIATGAITFAYSEKTDGINIENSLPLSDEVGKNLQNSSVDGVIQGYFDFTVSASLVGNSIINYEVYSEKVIVPNEISEDYVKIYLTDGITENPYPGYDGASVPTYSELRVAESDPAGRRLYTDTFSTTSSKNFRLRMWLADTYTISNDPKEFSIKINVKAFE